MKNKQNESSSSDKKITGGSDKSGADNDADKTGTDKSSDHTEKSKGANKFDNLEERLIQIEQE